MAAGSEYFCLVPDESQSKFLPEGFDDYLAGAVSNRGVVLYKGEGVHNGTVHQEPKNVFVTLLCLGTQTIVPPELIAPVNPTHEPIVGNNTWGTWHGFRPSIFLLPLHCVGSCGLAVGGHHRNRFFVLPEGGHQIASLPEDGVASLQGSTCEIEAAGNYITVYM